MKATDLELGKEYAYSERNGWADASKWGGQNPPSRVRLATLGDARQGRVFCELVEAGGGRTLWVDGQTIGPGGRGWLHTRYLRGPWAECFARWQASKDARDADAGVRRELRDRAGAVTARIRSAGLSVDTRPSEGQVTLPLATVEALADALEALPVRVEART